MEEMLSNIVIPKNITIYSKNQNKIIFNPETVSWLKVDEMEYKMFLDLKDNSYNNLENELDEKIKGFIFKLVIEKIIYVGNNPNIHFKEVKPKLTVYYSPTETCNLRCLYCYADANSVIDNPICTYLKEDTIKAKEIITQITDTDAEQIVFTGGEPLLRKDIFELAIFAKSKGLKTAILTNGTLINDSNYFNFKCFDYVKMSLDSSEPEINDSTRGLGTFKKVINAVKLLKSIDIDIRLASVITKRNMEYMEELVNFMEKELDVKNHNISTHISQGRGKVDNLECSCDEVLEFRRKYINAKLSSKNIKNMTSLLQPMIKRHVARKHCGAGVKEIYINSKGEVFPCRLMYENEHCLGNLFEIKLKEILKTKKLKDIQNMVYVENITTCKGCEIKYICGGGCRHTHSCYTGSLTETNSDLCKILKNEIEDMLWIDSNINPTNGLPLEVNLKANV